MGAEEEEEEEEAAAGTEEEEDATAAASADGTGSAVAAATAVMVDAAAFTPVSSTLTCSVVDVFNLFGALIFCVCCYASVSESVPPLFSSLSLFALRPRPKCERHPSLGTTL